MIQHTKLCLSRLQLFQLEYCIRGFLVVESFEHARYQSVFIGRKESHVITGLVRHAPFFVRIEADQDSGTT